MKKTELLIFFIIFYYGLFAQINKDGIPFTTNYSPQEYGASEQNWSIVQDHRGVMYFGNNDDGVLEYDGTTWRKIPVSNNSIVRSLAIDDDGIIYVGAVDEIGVLLPNISGKLNYKSLTPLIDSSSLKFSNVWKTYASGTKAYFCSTKRIFIFEDHKITAIDLPKNSFYSFLIDSTLYLGDFLEGLKKYNGTQFDLVRNGDFFSHKGIFTLDIFNDSTLLVGTYPDGLFLYHLNGQIETYSKGTSVNRFLIDNQLYHSTALINDDFAFATLNRGLIIFDHHAELKSILNKTTGLQDETVINVFQNHITEPTELWLALNSGISKVEIESPFRRLNENQGIQGAVNDMIEFNHTLFVGTSLGVFYLKFNSSGFPEFVHVDGIDEQVWSFLKIEDAYGQAKQLLAGTITGLFSIDLTNRATYIDTQIRKKDEPDLKNYITKLYCSKNNEHVYVGMLNALFVIRHDRGKWERLQSFPKVKDEVRHIIEDQDGSLWIGTYFNGIIHLFPENVNKTAVRYNEEQGLPSKKDICVQDLDGEIVFGTEKGLYKFNDSLNRFEPDTRFGKRYVDGSMSIFRINKDRNNFYWISASRGNRKWVERGYFNDSGEFIRDTLPFKRLPNEQSDVIYHDVNNITWLGSSSGIYSFNPVIKQSPKTPYLTLIRKVTTVNDSVLFAGTYYSVNKAGDTLVSITQPEQLKPILTYNNNDISFEYAAPYFVEEKKTQYSYHLDGYKDTWSKWNSETKAVFTNLHEGNYIFKVKAKNIYGLESEITSYQFTILSPWYRTIVAYIIYGILIIAVIVIIVKLYTRKLKLEKIRLEGIVQERTAEIRCQKEDIERKSEILKEQKEEIEAQAVHLSRANKILHQQKEEILKQKEEITSSIVYAKRIQRAIVPSEEDATKLLKDYFLLWRPRDIVSGDFWWMGEKNNQIVLAAADCTGHGVPGAFMSMLGVSFLNEIVNQQQNTQSHEILNQLRFKVKATLGQTGKDGEAKDGMDIALVVIDFSSMTLQYSGAYNPLYIFRKGELLEYKADRNPIGIYIKEKESFTQNVVQLEKDDTLYIFSDGYIDQFGGEDRMKYTSKRFKEFLLTIQDKPMAEQRELLNTNIDQWRGDIEQIDDIIVLGVRMV